MLRDGFFVHKRLTNQGQQDYDSKTSGFMILTCNDQKGAADHMDGDPYSTYIPAAGRSWLNACWGDAVIMKGRWRHEKDFQDRR